MAQKLYTRVHPAEILKPVDGGGQFTSDEHSHVSEKQFGEFFRDRETLLAWYLSTDYFKLEALAFLIGYIKENKIRHTVSFGAGTCVMEYLLGLALSADPSDRPVISAEFDTFFLERASQFFAHSNPRYFDFHHDDVAGFIRSLGTEPELVFSFGSFYVMDDETFVSFLKGCREAGVERIIDFHAGYLPLTVLLKNIKIKVAHAVPDVVKRNSFVRKVLKLRKSSQQGGEGKFHGYARNYRELTKIYKAGGFEVERRVVLKRSYKGAFVLRAM